MKLSTIAALFAGTFAFYAAIYSIMWPAETALRLGLFTEEQLTIANQ